MTGASAKDASTSANPGALPEVDVAGAPPEIASIYADIARLSGIPLPALIWRHLATFPSALPEAWRVLRPFYASGIIQDAAWRTVETTLAGKSAGPDAATLCGAGLGSVIDDYARVLQSYNRSNPLNFLGVRLLLAAMRKAPSAAAPAAPPARAWSPPAPIADLVPMLPVTAIPADIRALINAIAADPTVDRARIVPSLYRHLVPWPALVRLLHDDLVPRIGTGELPDLLSRTSSALQGEADRLSRDIAHLQIPALDAVSDVLDRFSALIPEMIVIGTILQHGLARPPQ